MSNHIEWVVGQDGEYRPPFYDVNEDRVVLRSDPDFTDEGNTENNHAFHFNGAMVLFDDLGQMHDWLDRMKAQLPKPPPGKDSGLDEIEAFLNG